MTSRLAFVTCFACVFGCAQTQPEAPSESREPVAAPAATPASAADGCRNDRVKLLLSAPHDPPTRDQIARACKDPVPLLVGFASDTSLRGLIRLRAIEALGRFGGRDAKAALADRATAAGDLASVRRAALAALFEASRDDPTTRERVGLRALSDADGHVRVAAARLLHGIHNQSVTLALTQARDKETESFVRSEIERALTR